jgi:hemerythrin-like metal-binding protein
MPLPPWSSRDSLGDPVVDEEHRRLLELLQWLESELFLEHDMDNAKVSALAKELNNHVDQHFFHEEEFMRSLPSLSDKEKAAHARDHEHWRARIQEHLPALLRANTDLERRAHLARILRVAKGFWQEHFQTFDRKLGEHKL